MFQRVLEFLYTGIATIRDKAYVQSFSRPLLLHSVIFEPVTFRDDVHDLLTAADLLGFDNLATICRNVLDDNEFLNPSIGMPFTRDISTASMH